MANEYKVPSFSMEVLRDGTANGRVFNIATEVLRDALGPVRLFHTAVEVLHSASAATKAQIFLFAVEVLRDLNSAPPDDGFVWMLL